MLYTEILKPIGNTESFPFLLKRTPYGSETPYEKEDSIKTEKVQAPKR